MMTVTISEAKAKLSALVEAAQRGEDVLILRGAKPAVTLTPVTEADLALWPGVPKGALTDFEKEIAAERTAGELKRLGKNPGAAAKKLKR
jgi:prevent-host-death family protein